jgi:hypothetical protein
LQDARATIKDEGQVWPMLLMKARPGRKDKGHTAIVALKVSRHRKLETKGIVRQGHVSTLDWLDKKIIVNHE